MIQSMCGVKGCIYFNNYVVGDNFLFDQLFCFFGGYFGNVLFFIVEDIVNVR